jgi:cytochrome c-type biogenesis protein CcsB
LVYYSPLFILLQFLLVINFLLVLIRYNYIKRRKWTMIVLHFALVVTLGGALTTFLFGKEGQVHIREGEQTDVMIMHTSRGVKMEKMPFVLELIDFRLDRYPGSRSPSSYESNLKVYVDGDIRNVKIFMNNVLDLKGYRFFQASYDEDELGTILSVNKDVMGRTITYCGYFLLMVGFLMMFFMPNSRFRKLILQLREAREETSKIILIIAMIFVPFIALGTPANSHLQQVIPEEHAARFGALPVQFHGRIMPMNTFSSEILRKIYKEQTYGNLSSDQFLLGLLSMPQMWMQVPFIEIPNEQIALQYNLPKDFAPYSYFFDKEGNYRLLSQLQHIYHHTANDRTMTEKDLIKLDERIQIVYQLTQYTMPGIFPNPGDPTHTWYAPGEDLSNFNSKDSILLTDIFKQYLLEVRLALQNGDWSKANQQLDVITRYQLQNDKASLIHTNKINAEIRYNKMNIFSRTRVGYLIFGGILLILAFIQMFQRNEWLKTAIFLVVIFVVSYFIYHTAGMGLRWYISGYAPWSNSYETMVYVAWATVLAGFIFGRKSLLTMALATLFGGIILFVSGLNWMDPQINTLVPVLKSPWLMFHVAVIVAAYGFFGISFLLGIANLSLMVFTKKKHSLSIRVKELSIINNLSLLVGLALMTIGTFLGAIWANESWGRYWGWDPKETWALITIVVYSIVTHLHLVKKWQSEWTFNLLSVFAFSSVLMTFLGVNYFLSGMHSYGQTNSNMGVFLYIAVAFVALGILAAVSRRK